MSLTMNLQILLLIISMGTVALGITADKKFEQLEDVFMDSVYFDFLTSSTLVMSQRTSLSLVELKTKLVTPLVGSSTAGGYVDGKDFQVRFGHITDVAVQGNYIYIADYSCIRVYDIERKLVATLAGVCGRVSESRTPSVIPETFKGPLKIAVSARDLYVLDGERVTRLDKETGASWLLSVGEKLSDGKPTSIEIDKYTNTLFIAVTKTRETNIIAVDIANGRQTLYTTIETPQSDDAPGLTTAMASVDVAPNGTIYVLEPNGLHFINRKTINSSKTNLTEYGYGYHEVAASTQYLVLSQEYYSRMYRVHVMSLENNPQVSMSQDGMKQRTGAIQLPEDTEGSLSVKIFESQTFYLAIVFPSALFLLVIVVIICATRHIIKNRAMERKQTRPASETSSEKCFLNNENGQTQDSGYWM